MSSAGSLALLGDFSHQRIDLDALAAEFGWNARYTSSLAELARACAGDAVVAVMIDSGSHPWAATLHELRKVAPHTPALICSASGELHYREEMMEQGAFNVLMSPLDPAEVHQALGFVWAAAGNRKSAQTESRDEATATAAAS